MQEWIINLATNHAYLVYLAAFFLTSAEGPILSILFGVLLQLGYFSFLPVYAVLMGGDLFSDSVWYFVGYRFGRSFIKKFGKYVSVTEERVVKTAKIFHRYTHRILIISKITNGFGFSIVTLITAGMVKIPFFKYLSSNLIGQFVWTGMLIAVGFFFSNMYLQISTMVGKLSFFVLIIILIIIAIGYQRYLRTVRENLVD